MKVKQETMNRILEDGGKLKEENELLRACVRAVIDWTETPESEPCGDFAYFAEVIVPELYKAYAKTGQG